jgi:hypothetical protein
MSFRDCHSSLLHSTLEHAFPLWRIGWKLWATAVLASRSTVPAVHPLDTASHFPTESAESSKVYTSESHYTPLTLPTLLASSVVSLVTMPMCVSRGNPQVPPCRINREGMATRPHKLTRDRKATHVAR